MVTQKRYLLFSIAILLSISSCGRKKITKSHSKDKRTHLAYNDKAFNLVDLPLSNDEVALADENVVSYFDENEGEFVAYDAQDTLNVHHITENEINDMQKDDYAWVDEADKANEFKNIYFEFDRHSVRPDQKDIVAADIEKARELLKEAREHGDNITVCIEGHCDTEGTKAYNIALSEKRAKAVADFFVAEGIPQENIKIVGRGQEFTVAQGTREQQWPNRRVEVKILYS